MNVKMQLKADEAREGMRVTYGTDSKGTLTGETRVTRGVTRFKVRPIDGGRVVWVVYVWEVDAPAPIVPERPDPRVVPVPETLTTAANMFDPSLTIYADGTRVVARDVSPIASEVWDGRTGVTVGRLPSFPYSFQAVRWDDNGEVDNVVPHILRELPAPVAPLAPGDRVEVGGRERVVTSVVPSRYRGRQALYVAHVHPGDADWTADVTEVPVPLESTSCDFLSPRALAAHVLTSAAHTLRPAGIIVPETPPAARREYVDARERGEGVALALYRARLEMVADAVLSPSIVCSGWDVDPEELFRTTVRPELDALSGTVRDAVTGERRLFPIVVPDGIALTVTTERDDYSDRAADEECYSPEDLAAWREDRWEYRTVVVTATDVDGAELASSSLGGVEVGDYWPGSEPAQIWHAVPDLIRETLDDLPEPELPMTCGTCGHRYADNTPAGRCPREADHGYDDMSPLHRIQAAASVADDDGDGPETMHEHAVTVLREVAAELNRYTENAEPGTTVQDAATDVVQRLFDLYGVRPTEREVSR